MAQCVKGTGQADSQSPEGDVLFEEHTLTDAEEIEIKIGWADKPYYDDPREKGQGVHPSRRGSRTRCE